MPRLGAHQQQVRHVGARDEEHERDGGLQDDERRADAADDVLLQIVVAQAVVLGRWCVNETRCAGRSVGIAILVIKASISSSARIEILRPCLLWILFAYFMRFLLIDFPAEAFIARLICKTGPLVPCESRKDACATNQGAS